MVELVDIVGQAPCIGRATQHRVVQARDFGRFRVRNEHASIEGRLQVCEVLRREHEVVGDIDASGAVGKLVQVILQAARVGIAWRVLW